MNSTSFQFLVVLAAPAGHPREADAVLDDREQLTVRELLRLPFSEVGPRRVEAPR